MMKAVTLAQAIPQKLRTTLYSVLVTVALLELVWDLIPDVVEGRIHQSLNIFGFGVAIANSLPSAQVNVVHPAVGPQPPQR